MLRQAAILALAEVLVLIKDSRRVGCFSSGFGSCGKQAVPLARRSAPGEIKAELLERIDRERCGLNGMGAGDAAGLWD